MLNQAQMDDVIENLSVENADFVVDFYHLSRNEFGFQHSRVARFLVLLMFLARKRRFKDLAVWCFGSNASRGRHRVSLLCFVCKLLFSSFKGWDSSNVMKEQNFATIDTNVQHFVFINLRHSEIMWDVYNDIKRNSGHSSRSARTSSINLVPWKKRWRLTNDMEKQGLQPEI
ncbi:hypothetical protein NC653_025445 [Populus alba x Populus x berolinensis]|uniref:Uncharacterized protein n=1 Tax=Populus alba x Populus x berolinensis TaxID=444605 RepID=A0AAD6Q913_9ROSI|nr:hypothetical protein NC653_025445 [Populus alba x Populus x berolinensis]